MRLSLVALCARIPGVIVPVAHEGRQRKPSPAPGGCQTSEQLHQGGHQGRLGQQQPGHPLDDVALDGLDIRP